jgi:hypothetical protein
MPDTFWHAGDSTRGSMLIAVFVLTFKSFTMNIRGKQNGGQAVLCVSSLSCVVIKCVCVMPIRYDQQLVDSP